METPQVSFKQVVSRGCGLDLNKKVVVAIIDGEGLKKQTREFSTVTSSLKELSDWLLENGITHVAIESTGVFWKPVCNILEPAGITVWVFNAAHVKYVPMHKTGKKDGAWLCKLLLAGLLKPSYIPGRVAETLLYLIHEIYKSNRFSVHLSRQEFAEMSNMTKESLVSILQQFKESNLIKTQGSEIEILDEVALNHISKND